jgi:hypothetical protein
MEEIKKPKLTNQRLAWLIKRDPCRKAWLLGIKRETFESKFIPLWVSWEKQVLLPNQDKKQEEFQPFVCDLAVTPQDQDRK